MQTFSVQADLDCSLQNYIINFLLKNIKVSVYTADIIKVMITAQRPKILVVDDNLRNAALIEGYLKPYYDVIKAYSGEECLELIEKEGIAVVILDVVLPGINGFDVCKKIKENETTKKIPVILIPAFPTGQEKTRSLQVGAEDFISRPFSMHEVVARVKALLKIKDLYNDLELANKNLSTIISYTAGILEDFDPMTFNENKFYKSLPGMLLRRKPYEREKPTHVFLGKKHGDAIKGGIFSNGIEPVECIIPENFYGQKDNAKSPDPSGIRYSNHTDEESILEYQEHFHHEIRKAVGRIINFAAYISRHVMIVAFNYGRAVNHSDAQVLRGLTIHSPFFKALSKQTKETGDAFLYMMNALSRAAEANDEDTGNHILRVNKYAVVIAKQLGLSEKFVHNIGISAQMHDVGKIHVHPDILRKPGKLSSNEFEAVKQHPIYGARIIGEHPRLKMAQIIALTHHECWDGSGYPYGLKGDIIPVEGRILNIADQYDALRNARTYKPAFSHAEASKIITEGDGRTMPFHFDPEILQTFKDVAGQMEDIYSEFQG